MLDYDIGSAAMIHGMLDRNPVGYVVRITSSMEPTSAPTGGGIKVLSKDVVS